MVDSGPVYIVDDAADYRFLVQQVFNRFLPQCAVRFFTGGADLIHAISFPDERSAEKPRLIVLDLDMPGLNGLQTLEFLKRHADWQNIPVMMMTNRNTADFRQASYQLGADGFLLKPLDLMGIRTMMAQLCEYEGNFSRFAEVYGQ